MSFQFPRKPEKQAFSLLKCRIKNKLLHVAVSAFHTPPRDSPKKCDKWHIWQFVAPLASSSQQPHPRTSSVAGKAHQAGRPATHTTYQATPGYSPPPEKHASVFGFSTYGYLQFDMISFHQHPSLADLAHGTKMFRPVPTLVLFRPNSYRGDASSGSDKQSSTVQHVAA